MIFHLGEGRLMRAAPVLWLAACIDYSPAGKPGDPEVIGRDTSRPDAAETGGDTDDTASSPEEVCDGLDNDGDGLVDEGAADVDGDGLGDCVDTTCTVAREREERVEEPTTCERSVDPPTAPWDVELLWEAVADTHCLSIVAADLQLDGTTEIVCAETVDSALRVLDGPTGTLIWRAPVAAQWTGIALADLDGGGQLEIVSYSPTGSVIALGADGTLQWESPVVVPALRPDIIPLEVSALGGAGSPGIFGPYAILRGGDGSLVAGVPADPRGAVTHEEVAVADLDGDAAPDFVSKLTRRALDGSSLWEYVPSSEGDYTSIPLVVQADADDDGEVVLVTDNSFALFEPDGTMLVEQAGGMYASIPCAGDMDGDGDMDLLVMGAAGSRAWSLPRTPIWQGPYMDVSEASVGCTTFDFDLDGAKEVIYGDGAALYILDGSTGAVLYQHDRFSATYDDRVLIVDLDGDGSVEIVSSTWSGGTGPSLRAYGNVNRDWPPGTQMWPSATWSGTSLLPDGRVPRTPHKPWLTTKVWRGQPEVPIFGSDLRPAIGDTCVASCEADGEVRMAVRLENLGPDEVEAGVPVAVYGLDGTGERVLLTVLTSAQWLDDGRAGASWEVVTTTAQAARGLVIVAGDDGTGSVHADDCGGDNNTVEWALTECP